MSITPSVKAAARAAYRTLWRASSSTFAGDAPTLTAWRTKMRTDALAPQTDADVSAYATLAREIADVLVKNVAQARPREDGSGVWRVRVTERTELGDNASVKALSPIVIPPKGRRRRGAAQDSSEEPVNNTSSSPPAVEDDANSPPLENPQPRKRLNYSQLKQAHRHRVLPEIREEDLIESFVRGHGPGGQSINKTNNNVQIIHKPSGIRVACQETRSLDLNRRQARKILLDKLDQIANPGLSKTEVRAAKQNERERRRRKKAKKRQQQRAGLNSDASPSEDVDD